MRNSLTFTAALAAGLLAGSPVHAAPAPRAAAIPQTPAELVHDLRGMLHHAGFRQTGGVGGDPPASVRYIQSFNRLMFAAPGDRLLSWQVGLDPLRDYLSTTLARWGATRVGSRWIWRDPAADESVTLWYQPAGVGVRALPRPEVELIIVHYSPPSEGR